MMDRTPIWLMTLVIAAAPLLCCCAVPDALALPEIVGKSTTDCDGHCGHGQQPDDAPAPASPDDPCDCHDQAQPIALNDAAVPAVFDGSLLVTQTPAAPQHDWAMADTLGPLPRSGAPPPISGSDRCLIFGVLLI